MADLKKVCIELLDEGTDTFIYAYVKHIEGELYELQRNPCYNSEDQLWDFLPGSIVRLKEILDFQGNRITVATHPDPRAVRIMMPSTEEYAPPWREAYAIDIGNGRYEVQATPHYTPEQKWEYAPGSVVHLKQMKTKSAGDWLVPDGYAE